MTGIIQHSREASLGEVYNIDRPAVVCYGMQTFREPSWTPIFFSS